MDPDTPFVAHTAFHFCESLVDSILLFIALPKSNASCKIHLSGQCSDRDKPTKNVQHVVVLRHCNSNVSSDLFLCFCITLPRLSFLVKMYLERYNSELLSDGNHNIVVFYLVVYPFHP